MKTVPETHRGAVDVKMPGLTPVVFSALEARNIAPQMSQLLTAGHLWVLLYFHSPARFKLHGGGSSWISCVAATAMLLAPGTRYHVDTTRTKALSWHTWMVMDGLETTPLVALLPEPPLQFVTFLDSDGILATQLKGLIDAIEEQKASPFWAMQMHGRVIMDILACSRRDEAGFYRLYKAAHTRKPDPLVGRVVSYMEAHIAEKLTLAKLAQHVNAGPSTVSHRFLAFTGESPMLMLRRMRLIRAKVLLVQGHKLTDIASTLGFYDEHHLSLSFKQAEHVSPRAFLKQVKRDGA